MRGLFSFPNPVNLAAARTVAAGVCVLVVLALALRSPIVLCVVCAGFWARVLTGPTLSPLGQLATRVVAPRLSRTPAFVPGPPKRFAQGMGAAFSSAAVASWITVGWTPAAWLLVTLLAAAFLEAAFSICTGCIVFSGLMRVGVVPTSVCAQCTDLTLRSPSDSSMSSWRPSD